VRWTAGGLCWIVSRYFLHCLSKPHCSMTFPVIFWLYLVQSILKVCWVKQLSLRVHTHSTSWHCTVRRLGWNWCVLRGCWGRISGACVMQLHVVIPLAERVAFLA
jgi:hypothetical protein